ncbi:MAG: AI-2E family transporter [Actinomycetaceae bacterium]|nr:AI-2E family transporter [Actinomycetaceae bacterium]
MPKMSMPPQWELPTIPGLLGKIARSRPDAKSGPQVVRVDFPASESLREDSAHSSVPWTLRVAAAVSWRALIVAVAAAGVIWLTNQLMVIIMPVAIALLLASLLNPFVSWMHRVLRFPRALAAAAGLILTLVGVIVALSLASSSIINQIPLLINNASSGLDQAIAWVDQLPFEIDTTALVTMLQNAQEQIQTWVQRNSQSLASGALTATRSAFDIVAGLLLVLFCLFFFLKDGRSIWIWIVRLFPEPARVPVHESAIRGWVTLTSYVRTQIQIAAIDALGIGVGAYFLGLPMVVPIVVVVFFGSFIPIIGALLSGFIAVLVALFTKGITAALIMVAIILAVQQIEGNLLAPLLMSNAVSLHPVAVILVVTACGTIAGIPGAVFGVPIAAFLNATFLYLHGYDPIPSLATDKMRPGGAPGTLSDRITASYMKSGAAPVVAVDDSGKVDFRADSDADGTPDGLEEEEESFTEPQTVVDAEKSSNGDLEKNEVAKKTSEQ